MAKLITKKKKASSEPDELMTLTQRVWVQISDNPTRAAALAGGVVGAVLLVLFGLYLKERAEENRTVAVSQAIARYQAEDDAARDGDAMRAEFLGLADKYSGSAPGGQALYYLGGILVEEGDYEPAVDTYRKVRKEYGDDSILSNAAALGLAYTHLLMEQYEEALHVFQELLALEGSAVPRTQIQMETGTILERLGRTDEAAAAYRTLVESGPETIWGLKAAERLKVIEGA